MTTPSVARRHSAIETSSTARTLPVELALPALTFAGTLAALGDILITESVTTLGFAVWIVLTCVAFIALAWRVQLAVPRETQVWLGVAAGFAVAMAWRDSSTASSPVQR